jgi:tetratricopeptide (TPR) repeat protein
MNTGSGSGPDSNPDRSADATLTGAQSLADVAPGTVLANRFRIEGLLGIGGMGMVYRATDVALGVVVAVKVLRTELANRPDAFERFRQELLLSRQVSSAHVVRIHDIAEHQGRWLISMDLIEGQPLDKVLDNRGALPVEEAVAITRQLALGLSAAHARQVIHRDLKPSNVLLDAQGTAYISDFGIARSLGTSGLTRTGTVIGTPDYLSPEQARAQPVDGRSDLYALGLLLYEMLAGQPAFAGGTASESLTQRLLGPPPSIRTLKPQTPAWVERLLDRLLRPNPAHRLQDAAQVVLAIDQRAVPRDFRPGRKTWLAAAGVVVLATAGVLLWRFPLSTLSAAPPPDRLLVLPVENASGESGLEPALAASAEHLRQYLDGNGTLPVVSGERVEQAIAQLELPDSRIHEIKTRALLRLLPATSVLRPRLQRVGRGYRLDASLRLAGAAEQSITGGLGSDLLTATRAFEQAVGQVLLPGAPAATSALPATGAALQRYGDGLLAQRRGRLDLALPAFTDATGRDPRYAAAWLALSRATFLAGQPEAAAAAARHGLGLQPGPSLREALGQWQALASGTAERAIAAQQQRVQARPDDLDALLRLAFLQGQSGDTAAAIANLERLIKRDGNDPRAWYLLGKYSIMRGQIRPAVDEFLVRALVLYKRGRNPFGEAETVNALGVGYSRLGQTSDALEQYHKAVELRRALGDRRGVASTLRNLAQLATVQGRFDQAQAQLVEARALFEALGDNDGLGAVDNELGLLAEERGDFAGALVAFRRSLRTHEQSGDAAGAAESLNDIGFAQYQLGDYDSAQVFWQQALTASTRLDDGNGIVRAQQNLGSLEIARGRWPEARRLLQASLATAEGQQMVEETAVSRYYLAELESLEGHVGTALEQLGRAQSLFAKRQDQRGLIDSGLLHARIVLAANALADTRATLARLQPQLAAGSDEQKAQAALLEAEIARRKGDPEALRKQAALARTLAEASGVQALKLRAALYDRPAAVLALDAATIGLGNLPLRLDWLRVALRARLAAGNDSEAASFYRRAMREVDGRDRFPGAFELHWLGAQALRRQGDVAAAALAQRRAAQALESLHGQLPERYRAALAADPQVQEFQAADHGR